MSLQTMRQDKYLYTERALVAPCARCLREAQSRALEDNIEWFAVVVQMFGTDWITLGR